MAIGSFSPEKDIPDLGGKVILITGGTTGLGAGVIEYLAPHNPGHIYFTGRRRAAADALIAKIHATHPDVGLTFIEQDLKSFASVAASMKDFLSKTDRLDVLLCNAGIMCVDPEVTSDGYEIQFQVNHLSHALMIKMLLPLLQKTAQNYGSDVRVINMSSLAHDTAPSGGIQFSGLKTSQAWMGFPVSKWRRYGQAKLANMLYAEALAKRYPDIVAVSLHPGVILTELFDNVTFLTKLPALIINYGKLTSVEEGPYNQCWAISTDKSNLKSGEYYDPIGVVGARKGAGANNPKLADELWDWTQKQLESFS